jgi:hypothetical protein
MVMVCGGVYVGTTWVAGACITIVWVTDICGACHNEIYGFW